MAAIGHTKSITVADATGTVTYWNGATTASIAATNIVRPSDWNSAHYFTQTISGAAGNTYGTSTFAGSNFVYGFTGHQYGSVSTAADAATLWFGESDAGAYTAYTYQNRQLGASSQVVPGQNSLWLVPFRVGVPVSASSLMLAQSFTGSASSATTAQYYQTQDVVIYSQHTDPASTARFDSWWSSQRTLSAVYSATNSAGWAYNGAGSSGGNTTIVSQQFYGVRQLNYNIGSTMTPGLYIFGLRMSSTTSNYTAFVRSNGLLFDAPMPLAMGSGFGSSVQNTIGYVDAGTWTSQTTGGIPASVNIGHIRPVSNFVPYFKIGAL